MDSEMGEAGESTDEVVTSGSELGCAKLNGDMNGAYEEDEHMDCTESSASDDQPPSKRITSSESDSKGDSGSVDGDVPNSSEVPKSEQECVSSNGYSHDGGEKDIDNSEKMECDDGTVEAGSDIGNNGVSEEEEIEEGTREDEKGGDVEGDEGSASVCKSSDKQSSKSNSDTKADEASSEKVCDGKDKEGEEENLEAASVKSVEVNKEDSEEKDDEKSESNKEEEEEEKVESEHTLIEIDVTPEKAKKPRKSQPINITPRRSSRNLNKQKSYIEKDDELEERNSTKSDDLEIEEIQPTDPLADIPVDKGIKSSKNKTTIVVNDTKRLAEIAAGSKNSKGGKKEPTLVIIDTNSILSGRGPVPVSSSASSSSLAGSSRGQNHGSYSVMPVSLPSQGIYPPNIRAPSSTSIKPVVVSSQQVATPKQPVVLPSLTDDMYVVEAPSFIVPYVYEKPPIKPLKEYVEKLEQTVKELQEKEDKEKKEKEEQERKNKSEDEKKDDEESEDNEDNKEKDKPEKMEVDESEEKKDEKKNDDDEDKPKDLSNKDKDKDKEKDEKQTESVDSSTQEGDGVEIVSEKKKKEGGSYFDGALGKFFMQIGINLVQEHVQTDLLRSQKRKRDREGTKCAPDVHMAINSLIRTLEFSKENNEPFKMDLKKCEFCSFKTESQLVMAHHLETPHMRNYVYRCNFCTLEVRSPHDILFHMEAEHNVRGRLERAPAFHQCPSCPFEDNQKGKLTRHLVSCSKKYRPERNQEPPLDWEPPAKIPRVPRNRPTGMSPGSALYQAAMSGLKQGAATGVPHPLLPKLLPQPNPVLGQSILSRGRGRPQLANRYIPDFRQNNSIAAQQKAMAAQMRPGMVYRPSGTNAQPQVLLPTSYQIAGSQLYQVVGNQGGPGQLPMVGGASRLAYVPPSTAPSPTSPTPVALVSNVGANSNSITIQSSASPSSSSSTTISSRQSGNAAAKLLQQPSISITPLPRQQSTPPTNQTPSHGKPGRPLGSGKATFVICEICDGYIKDLELLRNHMQWIHKVKIHPKMIYNRPPLNCQKCQFRFFTDQGLERHLLGSHGLVTSSMQEAANKGKDGGRCPVCGRVYQWKLLNHVARDHNMSLKPAHLSYKCTVCTATFGMYKQFESHVYSAHSVVAKRVMDKKSPAASTQPSTSSQGEPLLKPLKINDEITIIPQPPRSSAKSSASSSSKPSSTSGRQSSGSTNSSTTSNSNSSSKAKV